jgi:hypothetical protein
MRRSNKIPRIFFAISRGFREKVFVTDRVTVGVSMSCAWRDPLDNMKSVKTARHTMPIFKRLPSVLCRNRGGIGKKRVRIIWFRDIPMD